MRFRRLFIHSLVAVLITLSSAVVVAGCGGDETAPQDLEESASLDEAMQEDSPAATTSESTRGPETPTASITSALTVEDIDRWQRGMDAELQAVEDAEQSLGDAATGEDTLNAMMAATEQFTLPAGAEAAGVSHDRYDFIRSTLSSAVKYLTPIENEMDVSQMSESMVQQFEQSRRASLDQMSSVLPTEVLDALRARASELREQDVALAAARLRAAGMDS